MRPGYMNPPHLRPTFPAPSHQPRPPMPLTYPMHQQQQNMMMMPPPPYPMQQQQQQQNMMMMPPPPRNVVPFQCPRYIDPTLYSPTHKAAVQIRRVWNHNFEQEMENIRFLINYTPFKVVSMDTEFPGVLTESKNVADHRNPEVQYSIMKRNVDVMNLIQVGITVSDADGNLPTFGNNGLLVVWEFAISDFDIGRHPHNVKSIEMLTSRGLDFNFHRNHGINSHVLAQFMLQIGLLSGNSEVHWVTFHGSYDFGYLMKAITRAALPERLADFKVLVERYFGRHVYDVKYMMKFFPELSGGLETLANKLDVIRVLGVGHQAGSDSLLTQMVFQKLKMKHFKDEDDERFKNSAGNIFPLSS